MTRRRRARQPSSEPGHSHDRWLVSYADFVTLLFAFFTVMYASSTIDARKMASVVNSMHETFAGRADGSTDPRRSGEFDRLRDNLDRDLKTEISAGHVTVEADARGLVVSIREAGSFGTGSAELPVVAQTLIARLAERLRQTPNAIRVEGHTDDVPIQTAKYASNWDLSTARAARVVAFLIQNTGFEPSRLSAAGYAEYHPNVPNDSAEHRALNRRVDIVILNAATRQAEEPKR